MKTFKPQCLGVLHKTFENDGGQHFAPAVLVYFDFDKPGRPLHEVNMWKAVAEVVGKGAPLDECMPKPQPEVMVDGFAYPPGAEPLSACKVTLKFADSIEKSLYVVGDRHWKHGVASEPEPFREMEVSWHTAFGGEGFRQEPARQGDLHRRRRPRLAERREPQKSSSDRRATSPSPPGSVTTSSHGRSVSSIVAPMTTNGSKSATQAFPSTLIFTSSTARRKISD